MIKKQTLLAAALTLLVPLGCSGSAEHQYTKEQEDQIRKPTHQPPAEYKPDSGGGGAPPPTTGG